MSIEAYKIAVQIALVENVTAGLASLSRHFIATNRSAEELQNRLTSIGKMTLAGGALMAGGALGLKMLQGPLEEAKKFETELARVKALGYGDHVNAEAQKIAKGMNIAGSSATENLKMVREALSIMGDLDHVKEALPTLTKMRVGIETVMQGGGHGGGHGDKAERMFMDAIKVTELRGALKDPETFKAALNMMTQAYVATGGLVKPNEFLNMIKTGGVSAKAMNDQAFFYTMGHFMQEMGGSRVGTSLMSAYQNLVMGRTTQQVAEELNKSGLLDKSQIHYGKTGHITKIDPGALSQVETMRANPFEYLKTVILPKLYAQGVKDGDQMEMAISKLFSNRTASSLFVTMYKERELAARATERAKHAVGVDGLFNLGQNTLAGKEIDYEAKLANLKLELGQKVLPLAVKGLELLIGALDRVTAFAKEWPTLTKVLVVGFAALSGLAVVAGGILLFAAAFKALTVVWQFTRLGAVFSGLMSGIGTGLRLAGQAVLFLGRALLMNPVGLIVTGIAVAAFLLWKNWDSIKPKLLELWESIKTGFHTFIHMYLSGWQSLFNFLIEGINKLLPKAMELNRLSFADDYAKANLPQKGGSPYIKPATERPMQVTVVSQLDGREVARNTTMYQAREANRPGMGAPTFDPTMGARPVGLGYAR